jgi:tetratricopeptide (TPR) repeat protein
MDIKAAARALGFGKRTYPTAALVVALAFGAAAAPAALRFPGAAGLRDEDPARAALAEASAAKRAAQKLDDEAREPALLEVAARYDAIAGNGDFDPAARAEAAFRAGEILRARGRLAEAEPRFAKAVELGADAPKGREYAARGLLEQGAPQAPRPRRAGRARALRAGASALRRPAAHGATAMTWQGKLLLAAGRTDEAAQALQGFATEYPEFPKDAVRNADLLAVELFESGDEAGAKAAVDRVRAALAPIVEAGGKQGEAVAAALKAMRVTEMLGGY